MAVSMDACDQNEGEDDYSMKVLAPFFNLIDESTGEWCDLPVPGRK